MKKPLLELKSLYVNYGAIQALQDINLVVNEGEIVTLIGANGAGKSTTLRAISRLINPYRGQILYNGQDITRYRPDRVVSLAIPQTTEARRVPTRQMVVTNLESGA